MGKYLMPRGPFVEERHEFANSQEDRDAFAAAIVERGGGVVKRRKMLAGILGAGLGVFSIVALFRCCEASGRSRRRRSITPTGKRARTPWTQTGRRVKVGDIAVGGIVTVFPEGSENTDNGQGR